MTEKIKRQFRGLVVSNKQKNTAIVKVDRIVIHDRYQKRYVVSKKYACDAKIDIAEGDNVIFEECRPISKTKRWRIVKKV